MNDAVQIFRREIAAKHLLFKIMEYVETRRPGLLDFLEGNLDHLGDLAIGADKE